ncbi:MAG: hypothetical protein V2A74_01480 [bacterium]
MEYAYPLLTLLFLYLFYKRWSGWTKKRGKEMQAVREEFLESFRDRAPDETIDLAKRLGIQFVEYERIADGGQNGSSGKRFEVIVPQLLMSSVGSQALGRFLGTVLETYSMTDPAMRRCMLRLAMKLIDFLGEQEVSDHVLPAMRGRSVPVAADLETEVTRVLAKHRGKVRKKMRVLSDEMAVKAFQQVGIKIA